MEIDDLKNWDSVLKTHSWYEHQLDSFHVDLLKLKSAANLSVPSSSLLPEYIEVSCQKVFVRTSVQQCKCISRYDAQQWGKNPK